MSDKLQKYLEKGKAGRKDDLIKVVVEGEEWSVRRLTTMDVRRAYEMAYDQNGDPKGTYNEHDIMIVKATEHDFNWNDLELLKVFNCTEKFELPPRLLDNPDDYTVLNKAVRNFQDTKDALLKEAKNLSGKTEKQAG